MDGNFETDKKGPAVKFPPPLIFLICLAAGYGLDGVLPISLELPFFGKVIGIIFTLISLFVLLILLLTYLRAKTSIEPWKPTSHLITTGLYVYSRNPIYTALCLLNIGIGCYFNSLWMLLSFLPAAIGVYYIAIRKEEHYLTQKFGNQYTAYKNSVRRWL